MRTIVIGAVILLTGRCLNAHFYWDREWAGDIIYFGSTQYGMVLHGYAYSIGDMLQWFGLALGCARVLIEIPLYRIRSRRWGN